MSRLERIVADVVEAFASSLVASIVSIRGIARLSEVLADINHGPIYSFSQAALDISKFDAIPVIQAHQRVSHRVDTRAHT